MWTTSSSNKKFHVVVLPSRCDPPRRQVGLCTRAIPHNLPISRPLSSSRVWPLPWRTAPPYSVATTHNWSARERRHRTQPSTEQCRPPQLRRPTTRPRPNPVGPHRRLAACYHSPRQIWHGARILADLFPTAHQKVGSLLPTSITEALSQFHPSETRTPTKTQQVCPPFSSLRAVRNRAPEPWLYLHSDLI